MAADKKGITVASVEVSNFHRLTFAAAKLIPGVGLVRVTGRNSSGKTSLLRAIRSALGGAGEVFPDALREGTDGGVVRLELSNGFSVTRRFTAANPKGYLTVTGADGGEHKQAKLNEWLGPLAFDPLAFFDLGAERQRDILFSLGGDPELPAKLERIRSERAATYEERTPWISQKRRSAQVARPAGERPVPVDISAELRRMGELQVVERERTDLVRAHEQAIEAATRQATAAIESASKVAADLDRAVLHAMDAAHRATVEVERIRAALARALEAEKEAHAAVEEAKAEAAAAIVRAESLPRPEAVAASITAPDLPDDPSDEIEAIRARVSAADQVRETLRPWEAWDAAQAEMGKAAVEVERLTGRMAELERAEHELIAGAGIPVDGLGFSEAGAPLLNGHPLEVASGAERIRLAVAVALAANPDLRVCLIDEANDIDLEGLEELDRQARQHDFQVWACRLGLEGPGEVVVADGVAADAPAEAVH